MVEPFPFFQLTVDQFAERCTSWGWPKFRARQVADWVYRKGVTEPLAMSNLSRDTQLTLKQSMSFTSATTTAEQRSTDGTIKLLLTWPNGSSAETVMIPDGTRRTACVSSQVGCPVGCRFCASGINGVKGNLTAAQIVEQVFQLQRRLIGVAGGDRISNVVFMGMGEPLANYNNVMQAVRVLHDANGFNIGARKITISTVGVPAKIRELATEALPMNLAISLHAPNEKLRRDLIPWAEHFAMNDILDAGRFYFEQTGREITLEYILLSNVNDRPEHARQLIGICRTLRANVNLIRYNEVDNLPFLRPSSDAVMAFQGTLQEAGVNAHVRKSRGRDIDAACGQLRRKREQLVEVGRV